MINKIEKEIEDIRKRCDQNTNYISDREQVWGAFQKEVMEEFKKINETLKPIADTYKGVAFSGKWGGILLGLIVTISGLIWGWVAFLKPFFEKLKGR